MKKIVVLGNSIAGVKAIEVIRSADPTIEISMISFDGHYPHRKEFFGKLIANEISFDDILYKPKGYYEGNRITVIVDKNLSRINFKRNVIFCEDKDQIPYDALLISDMPNYKFPEIKGTNKSGVYGIKRLGDIVQIINALPFTDVVSIQSDNLMGLQIAMNLVKREKEVLFITPGNQILPSILNPQQSQKLVNALNQVGLRIVFQNTLSELLGDGELKAVRLKTGKVYASQMVLFSETREDLRFVSDSHLKIKDKICVDSYFKTNIHNVYALDELCELPEAPLTNVSYPSVAELEQQGQIAAKSINGEDISEPPHWSRTLSESDIAYMLFGDKELKTKEALAENLAPSEHNDKMPSSEDSSLD